MSFEQHLQQKIYRLETLRKYQAHYGPNTPYQIVVEINQLESELRRMLQADMTRRMQVVNQAKPGANVAGNVVRRAKKKRAGKVPFLGVSRATVDWIVTISLIGFIFLLGSVIFAASMQSRSTAKDVSPAAIVEPAPVLRPTFTPTLNAEHAPGEGMAVAAAGDALLPASVKVATDVATPVPTITPSEPTHTPTPLPTATPTPTNTSPPPPPRPSPTPAPPTPTPAPEFPFAVAEQGNRMFQKTSYHVLTIYVAITTFDNVPIGGLKIVGDHVPSGKHLESAPSDWNWSVNNCLTCDYVKFGNVKFEPGTFSDGIWNIHVADQSGRQLSPVVPLSYSADPEQWVWDFIIFRKLPGL